MRPGTLIVRYGAFAALASLANLGVQRAVLALDRSAAGYAAAVAAGTAVGLVVKYLLDKRWIFADPEAGLRAHRRKFALYAATGVITTLIFWGSETGFWLVWRSDPMRELGAILGLSVGYVLKYRLDRRLVFVRVGPGLEGGT